MRPKLIALLAVSAFALFGCASGEVNTGSSVEPSESATFIATPDAEQTPAFEPGPEEMFLSTTTSTFEGGEDRVSKKVHHKMEDEYILERGHEYCELIESGKDVKPITDTALSDDYEIENRIMLGAQIFLCPAD